MDVLTTILNAYGMEASEVTNVSDMLIQTQNLGKTTVAELSSSMGKVKFSKLKQYLENCGKTELTLTFTDIETIIGCNLCKSAYNYSAYWTPSPTHTMPNTILAAGFKVVSVDLLSNSLLLHKQ